MGFLKQLALLLWKNYVLQKRHLIAGIVEILVPILLTVVLISIRQQVDIFEKRNDTCYSDFNVSTIPSHPTPYWFVLWRVAYTPNDTDTNDLMTRMQKKLESQVLPVGYASEEDMLNTVLYDFKLGLAAVIINKDWKTSNHLDLTIRSEDHIDPSDPWSSFETWNTNLIYPILQKPWPRQNDSEEGGSPGYYSKGFLALQHAITEAVTEVKSKVDRSAMPITVHMQRYPYPPYIRDDFLPILQSWLPMILMLSFLYPVFNLCKNLVYEKEKKLKESMKMMGLHGLAHWTSWFLKSLVMDLTSCFFIVLLLKISMGTYSLSCLNYTNFTTLAFFLIVYIISLISFAFLVSTLFEKANTAATVGGLFYFLTFMPYFFIQSWYDRLGLAAKLALCLLPNTGMALGTQVIAMLEGTGAGLQWNNINSRTSPQDSFTMLNVIVMLLVDTVICLILTWYIDAIRPGEFGIPLRWNFPFTISYWTGKPSLKERERLRRQSSVDSSNRGVYFEPDPQGLKFGIEIRGLTKVYEDGNRAVKGLNISMCQGQITALLGHNGAGKTTTMSMLTGMIPPSDGTAIVNGCDIRNDIKGVRQSLGLCPQHDVLFDDLTVREHLVFFAKLKGMPSEQIDMEVMKMIEVLHLVHKTDKLSKTLSGGMKRKLSVGIAFIYGSEVVMLDEPTSGMDPEARRETWDLIQGQRQGRTLLLTTHFMDEADLLGDRIAIMAKGRLQCYGSPFFLKKKYGAGYHLMIVKKPGCVTDLVTDLVLNGVPGSDRSTNIGSELTFLLPDQQTQHFEALFNKLESNRESLGIDGLGVSVTTMEEVFLRVGQESSEENLNLRGSKETASNNSIKSTANFLSRNNTVIESGPKWTPNSGLTLWFQQLGGLLMKRAIYSRRNWVLTLVQFLIPALFLIVGLIQIKTLPDLNKSPPLVLSLDAWEDGTKVLFSGDDNDTLILSLSSSYVGTFSKTKDKPEFVYPDYSTDDPANRALNHSLLKHAAKSISGFNNDYIVSASFDLNETSGNIMARAMFNNQPFHAPPMALKHMDLAILRHYTNDPNYTIKITNHPLPRSLAAMANQNQSTNFSGFMIAFNLVFGICFLMSSFVIFIIKESSSGAKHLQLVCGSGPYTYWISTFIWDFVNALLPCILILIIFLAFQQDGYTSAKMQWAMFLLFVFYCLSMLPLMYLFSYAFTIPASGFTRMTMFNILTGLVSIIAVAILSVPQLKLLDVAKVLEDVFLIIPSYSLGYAIFQLNTNYQTETLCDMDMIVKACTAHLANPCCKYVGGDCGPTGCFNFTNNYLEWEKPAAGRMLVAMAIEFVCFWILIALVEGGFARRINVFCSALFRRKQSHKATALNEPSYVEDDSDVIEERKRVEDLGNPYSSISQMNSDVILKIQNLMKFYGDFCAVDGLSLAISQGECFGLLGVNGAGKTSTFKMLTGNESISGGDAIVRGHSVKKALRKAQLSLGYCPQFDAVIDQLTGRETLTLISRLRGIPESWIPAGVAQVADDLLLSSHLDKQIHKYSGGNKRKLSTAISLVGDPPIVFLDEPTTGMDPVARRLLWDSISRIRERGKAIVLTSHSMEECDVLCTRLAIMVNGKLRCLGSSQHLKNKFGSGYTLQIKVQEVDEDQGRIIPDIVPNIAISNNMATVCRFVTGTFGECALKDLHRGLVHYHLTNVTLTWASVFGAMERAKNKLPMADYSVSQSTLEQVFLNFSKQQLIVE